MVYGIGWDDFDYIVISPEGAQKVVPRDSFEDDLVDLIETKLQGRSPIAQLILSFIFDSN